jgi:predicted O-methyltransferase YrrM
MDLINPLVESYAASFTSQEDPLLKEIAEETYANHAQPHMLSGHVQGRFLEMISHLLQPKRILEIGTFTGYSALCLVKGLSKDGQLHTIELREDDAKLSRTNFDRSSEAEKIILHTGNALDVIPSLKETWDLVFIDADKPGYISYYELVLPLLRPGGFILADNVLFHGQVFDQPITGKSAKAIQAFNEHVQQDQRVEQVLLTIRDGLLLIRKK